MTNIADIFRSKKQKISELVNEVLEYYQNNPVKGDPELDEALDYLHRKKNFKSFPHFPCDFADKKIDGIVVCSDKKGRNCVLINNKRLYLRRNDPNKLRRKFAGLLREQDEASPHRYITPNFDFPEGAILFDVGAADANFSLSVVEKASRIFILEANKKWMKTLHKTFAPWSEKVTIINKYVSDTDSDSTVTIDSYTDSLPLGSKVFIKLDVEGAEMKVLDGAKKTLDPNRFDSMAVICTYHQHGDHAVLSALMREKKYEVETSRGYMLFHKGLFAPPYFRRGLIRCKRLKST